MKAFKRLVAITSTFALSLCLFGRVNAHAASNFEIEGTAEEQNKTVDLSLDIPSTFTIKIPKSITLDGSTKTAEYIVGVKGDLAPDAKVILKPDATATLTQEGREDITATVTQTVTKWLSDNVNKNTYSDTTGTITADSASAGTWTGTTNFLIKLQVGLDPGLYRNDTLVKSWDSLLSDNDIYIYM